MRRSFTSASLIALALALGACSEPPLPEYWQEAMARGAKTVADCAAVRCVRLDLVDQHLADYSVLSDMTHVRALVLNRTPLDDLGGLAGLSQLEELQVSGTRLTRLDGLSSFPGLRRLNVRDLGGVTDYGPVAGLTGVTDLAIGTLDFDQLSVIAAMPQLRTLSMSVAADADLSPLTGHPGLREVDLLDTPVADIGPLLTLPRLQRLGLATYGAPSGSVARDVAVLRSRGVRITDFPVLVVD